MDSTLAQSRTLSQISTLGGRVTTCENGLITGGSFASNTLTLSRPSGNLQIGGFPNGGAQSVDVSLSGSTLTVNVDGHSDSVNIAALNPLSGSIDIGSMVHTEGDTTPITPVLRTSIQNPNTALSTTVSINNLKINNVGNTSSWSWVNPDVVETYAYRMSLDKTKITSNISGSGTIVFKEVGFVAGGSSFLIYSVSTTIPDAIIEIDNGQITDAYFTEQVYIVRQVRPNIASKNIYVQY